MQATILLLLVTAFLLIFVGIPFVVVIYPKWKAKDKQTTIEQTLEQLKQTYDNGLITEEEYNKKRMEILDTL